jgi:EthD domain-containing protein
MTRESQAQRRPRAIYLARRHPFLDHRQFVSRWREHGILSQQLEGWRGVQRYEQNEALAVAADLVAQLPGGTHSYDGVGMSWFRDDDAVGGFGTLDQQTLLRRDELQTFDDIVAKTCFFGRESDQHGDRRCGVKLVSFLKRRDVAGDAPPTDDFRRLVTALLETPGFSDNVVKVAECMPSAFDYPGGDRPGLHQYGPVLEIGFADAEGLTAALADTRFSTVVRPAWENATDGEVVTVAVTELLLYDEDHPSEVGPL